MCACGPGVLTECACGTAVFGDTLQLQEWLHFTCRLCPPPPPLPQVIAAQGELNASRALKEAASVIARSPTALQLRYMQTLNFIGAEKGTTVLFPVPMDIMSGLNVGQVRNPPPPCWAPCLYSLSLASPLCRVAEECSPHRFPDGGPPTRKAVH